MQNVTYYSGAIDAAGCISNGWNLIKENYGVALGASLLSFVIISCLPCIQYILLGPIFGGVYYLFLTGAQNRPMSFEMTFKGFEKFLPLMVAGLIQSVPGIVFTILQYTLDFSQLAVSRTAQGSDGGNTIVAGLGIVSGILALLSLVVGVIWAISFWFLVPIVMEHNLPIGEAIKTSFRAGWANVGGLIVLAILTGIVALLGMLAICLGFFLVSIPVIYAAYAFAYRQVFPLLDQPIQNTMPPSPESYGSFA